MSTGYPSSRPRSTGWYRSRTARAPTGTTFSPARERAAGCGCAAHTPAALSRLAIVIALILLLLAGVATATYLVVRGNRGVTFSDQFRLLVVNPNGPGLRVAVSCPPHRPHCSIGTPVWSPDGRRVAFTRGWAGGMTKPTYMSVYVAAASGNDAKRVAPCGGCLGHLAWSPDGRWIAFNRDSKGESSLWVVAAAVANHTGSPPAGRGVSTTIRRGPRMGTCSPSPTPSLDPGCPGSTPSALTART